MISKSKKICAIVLSLALAVGVISFAAPKQSATTMANEKTVYDEIKLSQLSNKTLKDVADTALIDGAKAAEKVNSYSNKEDYKSALNAAMTSYYKTNNKKQMKKFAANLDKRAAGVEAGYKKAAKERAKGAKNGFVPGEVTAIFDADLTKKEIEDVCKSQDATLKKCYKIHTGDYMTVINISKGQTVDEASAAFSKLSFVQAADSNDLAKPTASPELANLTNDPYIGEEYHFDNMHVKGAWDYLREHAHKKVKVAVIDVGCYWDNPDIKNVVTDESYDFEEDKPVKDVTYNSKQSHGTAVVGVLAAESNNGKLLAGVASGYDNSICDVMLLQAGRYYSDTNSYSLPNDNTFEALNYALAHGAQVVNMSYGAESSNTTVDTYFKKLYKAGIVLVAAAGNNNSSATFYPSDSPYVISAAASDRNNAKASFSNWGSKKDILAPGDYMPCLSYYKDSIGYASGTSFASPATAAVAAMMLSVNPNLNTYDVGRIMQNTDTTCTDQDTKEKFDHGVINAEKCVKRADGYNPKDTFENETERRLVDIAYKANVVSDCGIEGYPLNNINDMNENTWGGVTPGSRQTITLNFDKQYEMSYIKVKFANQADGAIFYASSENGTTFSDLSYSMGPPVSGDHECYAYYPDKGALRTVKSIQLKLFSLRENAYIKEVEVWAYEDVPRAADSCTMDEMIFAPDNLKAEILGYHKVKLTWDVTDQMRAKGYEFDVYDEGALVATTKENSIILNDTVGRAGGLMYGVRSKYNGKVSSDVATYSTSISWHNYTTSQQESTTQNNAILTNLSYNKPAFASSEENAGTKAEFAFDGNENTRWSSQWTDDEWIYVDLGKVCTINKVTIKWEAARAAVYDTYLSTDGENWTKYAANGQNAEETSNTLGNRPARYVKMVGVKRNTGYGYSIYEMKVWGYDNVAETTVAPTDPTTTIAPTTTKETTIAPTTTVVPTTKIDGRRIITGKYDVSKENVAAGKTAFASSEENGGVKADKVCDGDMNTRWSSQWTDDEWIVVDLGEVMPIAQVKLHWEAAYGRDYVVQFSEDGETYYDKRTTTNNSLRDTIEGFPAEYTRYIRVKCSKRATGYGYSLFEIEAFPAILSGETTVAPTTVAPTTSMPQFTNLALGKNATASTYENDSMTAVKAFDGDMNTRWASAWEDNQFIRVNLESVRYINHIVINWEAAYGKSYEIQLSNEGKVWNTKKVITNSDGGIDTVQIGDRAQFVRVVCTERGTNYGFSMFEMAVMGY